jgi:transcriptional regulator with XRE-family HTH domain
MARIIEREKANIVGERIRYYRKLKKYSQKQLSVKLELMGVYVCRGSISRIEDGSRTVTDIELYAFAKALHVNFDDLFSNYDEYIDLF